MKEAVAEVAAEVLVCDFGLCYQCDNSVEKLVAPRARAGYLRKDFDPFVLMAGMAKKDVVLVAGGAIVAAECLSFVWRLLKGMCLCDVPVVSSRSAASVVAPDVDEAITGAVQQWRGKPIVLSSGFAALAEEGDDGGPGTARSSSSGGSDRNRLARARRVERDLVALAGLRASGLRFGVLVRHRDTKMLGWVVADNLEGQVMVALGGLLAANCKWIRGGMVDIIFDLNGMPVAAQPGDEGDTGGSSEDAFEELLADLAGSVESAFLLKQAGSGGGAG